MKTYTICYVSTARKNITPEQVHDLFEDCMSKNNDSGISGILLYNEGNFMQILEGSGSKITSLFQAIKEDQRHNNIITLYKKPTSYCIFKGYNSGFSTIENNDHIENLNDYLNLLGVIEDTNTRFVISILNRFLNTISPGHFVV